MNCLEAIAKPVLIYWQGTVSTVPNRGPSKLRLQPLRDKPQGLKPPSCGGGFGTTKVVPLRRSQEVLQQLLIQTNPAQSRGKPRGSKGFTLVETLMAIAILSVGIMSLATLIPIATQNDYRSRMDTTATFVAMRQLEQMLAQPYNIPGNAYISEEDGDGNTESITVSCGAPGCDAGAAVVGVLINFAQAAGDVPAGYRRVYTIPASSVAGAPKINGGTYDMRWHITQSNTTGVRTILIAVKPEGNHPGAIAIPVNLRAVKMK